VERRSMNAPVPAFASKIQRIAWERCGIVRSGEGLGQAVEQLESLAPESPEERNMREVALLIARCALARKESRGAHFRSDYPESCDAFARHSVVSRQADVTFR
jgi:L-aspartate oxidase